MSIRNCKNGMIKRKLEKRKARQAEHHNKYGEFSRVHVNQGKHLRFKACEGKKTFESEEKMLAHIEPNASGYECHLCGKWHRTYKLRNLVRGIRSRSVN